MKIKPNFAEIAKKENLDYRTVKRQYYQILAPENPVKPKTIISDFEEIINEKLAIPGVTISGIFRYIQANCNYPGSWTTLRNYVATIRPPSHAAPAIHMPHIYGKVAEVDWKENVSLTTSGGENYTVNFFIYHLLASGYKVYLPMLDKRRESVMDCLVKAFTLTGGIPKEVWFDNMSSVCDTLKHSQNASSRVNKSFKAFSADIGFKAILCRPYRPQTKGAVENSARLINDILLYDKEFDSFEELEQLTAKLTVQLNSHKSQAHGKIIANELIVEREYLNPLPNKILLENYNSNAKTRKVDKDSLISLENRKYSVPIDYIGQCLSVRETSDTIEIYDKDVKVCSHKKSEFRHNYLTEHAVEILRGDVLKGKPDDDIEEFIGSNMLNLDKIQRGEKLCSTIKF